MDEFKNRQTAVNHFAVLSVPLSGEAHHRPPDTEVFL